MLQFSLSNKIYTKFKNQPARRASKMDPIKALKVE